MPTIPDLAPRTYVSLEDAQAAITDARQRHADLLAELRLVELEADAVVGVAPEGAPGGGTDDAVLQRIAALLEQLRTSARAEMASERAQAEEEAARILGSARMEAAAVLEAARREITDVLLTDVGSDPLDVASPTDERVEEAGAPVPAAPGPAPMVRAPVVPPPQLVQPALGNALPPTPVVPQPLAEESALAAGSGQPITDDAPHAEHSAELLIGSDDAYERFIRPPEPEPERADEPKKRKLSFGALLPVLGLLVVLALVLLLIG